MSRRALLTSALVLLALTATIRPAAAAWPHEPNNGNVPLCTETGDQSLPMIVSDGAGGAIVTWQDHRAGNFDVYAQRVSAAGVPLWATGGVVVSDATGNQSLPMIVSDGAGGAIITWTDDRSRTTQDVYAQRVSASGVPQWTTDGVALCTAAGDQLTPTIAADGSGGAIVVWRDLRGGVTYDLYAQRVSAAGAALWTANGVALCTNAAEQWSPVIVSDGANGAIVAWQDYRSGNFDIYAQRVGAAGTTQWTADGAALCLAVGDQQYPAIAPDGEGGAIVTWHDTRGGTYDIYAQRVGPTGAMRWTADGVALCTAAANQQNPSILADGAGGAIVAWHDRRNGVNYDIYAQRVGAAGVPLWTADGVALCTAAGHQSYPMLAADGAGGAVVSWGDGRTGPIDVYAQRVSAAGVPRWTDDGVALCTAAGDQFYPMIAADEAGGGIVTWQDFRSGAGVDIYAQRVERYGQLGNPEPVIRSVSDVRPDQGGFVKLTWSASYLDADPVFGIAEYRVFRSVPGPLAVSEALRRGATLESDVAAREGRVLVRPAGAQATSWEFVGSQAAEAVALYSRVVATASDSVAGGNPYTWFMVEARAGASVSSDRWFSAPDSGYSVDDLPPATPAPFSGTYAAGTTNLFWNRNTEPDLAGYRLYRGPSETFVPGPGNLLAALTEAGYADNAGGPYVYKLTAVDSHGNESPAATLVPRGALDVGDAPQVALGFAPPSPNPARDGTTLEYTLSRSGRVRLSVYDAAGRRVLLLRDGDLPAGAHRERFALRDGAGRELASGLYLVRLEAEGRVLTRRLAAIR